MKITRRKTYYASGEHNVFCDKCGRKRKSSEVAKEWNGLLVCKEHWERRHPQDYPATVYTPQTVTNPRPSGSYTYVDIGDNTSDNL